MGKLPTTLRRGTRENVDDDTDYGGKGEGSISSWTGCSVARTTSARGRGSDREPRSGDSAPRYELGLGLEVNECRTNEDADTDAGENGEDRCESLSPSVAPTTGPNLQPVGPRARTSCDRSFSQSVREHRGSATKDSAAESFSRNGAVLEGYRFLKDSRCRTPATFSKDDTVLRGPSELCGKDGSAERGSRGAVSEDRYATAYDSLAKDNTVVRRSRGPAEDRCSRTPARVAKPASGSCRHRELCRAALLVCLTMSLLHVPVLAASISSSRLGPAVSSGEGAARFEEPFRESEFAPTGGSLDENELETIRRSIVQGLGLRRIPDPSKANVSQAEYERAHREYLRKVQLSPNEEELGRRTRLHVFHATEHPGNGSIARERPDRYYRRSLFFPVEAIDEDVFVDHATLRLLLDGVHDARTELEVQVYLTTLTSRELLVRKRLELLEPRDSRWIEFDSTEAASTWLARDLENLGLEVEFWQDGSPVPRTFSSPVLNVFTVYEPGRRRKRSSPEELMSLHKGRRTKCKGESKKCCRHELTVMFKDLKGFEFIVYPKMFDAGYCKGRCPPRYNPAHHHALLQSLLWKEDRKRVPKPCCAPSKLDQLMIVYFDENDSTELKISYWKNIQVLECACS